MKQFPKTRPQRKWLPIEEYKRKVTTQAEFDAERATFLEKLDASELLLTDWEQEFVGNYMQAQSEGREQKWFTEGRRRSADTMREKYGSEVGCQMPEARKNKTTNPNIPEAEAGCCMYLVRDEAGLQGCCNEPATCQTRAGFRYCQNHRDIAAEACKRKGTSLITMAISTTSTIQK